MIIGLIGFIGAGKGTVGDILSECGYTQDSFAKPLKDAVAVIFGWDRQMLEGATPESRAWREQPCEFWSKQFGYTFTPRLALQLMGTEAGRNVFHQDLWVISLLNRSQGKNVVVTDVRFKNEVKAIRDANGLVIRVRRGIDPLWYTTALLANGGDREALVRMTEIGIHPSEWDWAGSPIDYIIDNDGTLEDLREKVSSVLQNIRLTSASK
jgi:hypothetical protein